MDFDVIVVGAGHAGVEASLASSRMGAKTLLVTSRIDRSGYMSCNPSIGGLAKGHIVKEVDVLGGVMGSVTDASTIQFKRLNASKGPAVRGSRAQCDKDAYCENIVSVLKNYKNLRVIESNVSSLVINNGAVEGVILSDDTKISARSVIITTGTFMRGVMYIGLEKTDGGRVGESATYGISDQLDEHGFTVSRFKTGTPPRLHKDSINWDRLEFQSGDKEFLPFSFKSSKDLALPQIVCHLSHTTEQTHDIIRKNLHLSPMFTGDIEGNGPRYCPSIEDKITRFAERANHLTFLELEGLNTDLVYLQGISTSLPEAVQKEFLRTIPGLENVKIIRPGYAVEYDCIDPSGITHSLETKSIKGLFLAGQINGTSGYEEAAGQGLVAGVNAVHFIRDEEPLILARDQSYIGVLIDDLVIKGTKEPYRMFTSRAEHRLVLREDNVVERLFEVSQSQGLLSDSEASHLNNLLDKRQKLFSHLQSVKISPTSATLDKLEGLNTKAITKQMRLSEVLRRPELTYKSLAVFDDSLSDLDTIVAEPVEIMIKYEGYIKRQNELINIAKKMESMRLPLDLDYNSVRGLSNEEVEKLSRIRPQTMGQAQRVSGVNPSAIQSLLVYLKMHKQGADTINRI